jgi:hypothetical protein
MVELFKAAFVIEVLTAVCIALLLVAYVITTLLKRVSKLEASLLEQRNINRLVHLYIVDDYLERVTKVRMQSGGNEHIKIDVRPGETAMVKLDSLFHDSLGEDRIIKGKLIDYL